MKTRPGFALALTILVITGVALLASAAIMVGMNSTLIRDYNVRQDEMAHAADAGLERGRALLNSDRQLYPDTGYATLEDGVPVTNAGGVAIPGLRRWSYAGPIGITSGQYGVNGAVISVVRSGPNTSIRRAQVTQESFSKFAYFTDVEPSTIAFGGGDQLYGPVHSNDDIRIYSSGATFFGPVTTAATLIDEEYGNFREGYTEGSGYIPLPELADLEKLAVQAAAGGTSFTATSGNSTGRANTRIEFITIDLSGDGDTNDDGEGFIRVYTGSDDDFVVAGHPVDEMRDSRNCGHYHQGTFVSADDHSSSGQVSDNYMAALSSSSRACYLGGAPELTNGWVASNSRGSWARRPGAVPAALRTRPDSAWLFPINRPLNPDFKGVIYVDGDVAISGVVRGRVTIAATGNIVIVDDVTYATDPSVGNCDDILGLFAGGSVVVASTPLTSAWRRRSNNNAWISYDNTTSEFVHAFVLTLNVFTVEDYNSGPTSAEACESTSWGRGCLYLTGGIIQRERGPVGQSNGTGYLKRYSYDRCGATAPPPYFPTTGRFARGAYYEIDPTGFDVDAYFAMLRAGS